MNLKNKHSKFYVYIHLKPGTDEVFYVGRGQRKRIYSKSKRNKYWKAIYEKYGGRDVFKIEEGLTNEEANQLEMYWISQFKSWGFKLTNLTDGGETSSGYVCTEETKKKIGDANRGRKYSDEVNKKKGLKKEKNPFFGKKHSEETKAKLRLKCPRVGPLNGNYGSTKYKGAGHPRARIVLNLENGIYYEYVGDAAEAYNIKYSTLRGYLREGSTPNKTSLIYV